MADAVLARSPIAPAEPVVVVAGWEVSTRASDAALRLADVTPLAKVLVRATPPDRVAGALGVGFGRARRDAHGALVAGTAPGEWLLLGPAGSAAALAERAAASLRQPGGNEPTPDGDELVTVVDFTHSRALVRLTGSRATAVLAKLCALDWSDDVTPHGAARRTSVAGLATDVIRDDEPDAASYLLACERSSGQYLFDCLRDAGDAENLDVEGTAGHLRRAAGTPADAAG